MRDSELILTIYEPRWHGFARWTLSEHTQILGSHAIVICRPIRKGWVRRPRGSEYRVFTSPT